MNKKILLLTLLFNLFLNNYLFAAMNWTCATDSAAWSKRSNIGTVSFNNKMWAIGGAFNNDVWYSTDGTNWTCATDSAAWLGRNGSTSVIFDSKMWVLGGCNIGGV